jgi:S1-C subfamily serine protease
MKQMICICLALLTITSARAAQIDESVLKAESDRVAVVAKACRAAVAIFADGGNDGGSGVVISPDGYTLSNFHVTQAAGTAMKCGMNDGRLYDGVLVGFDPVGDVALVKLLGRNDFPCAELADSDQVRAGDWAFAIGNPFLLATDFKPSVSYGIISGVHRYQYPSGTLLEYADCIQTDAAINPGNSGGPLFNAQGQVIGINGRGSFEKRGRVNVGVGYAISINQIKLFLSHLKSGRIVDHATLGARVSSDDEGRVLVTDILEESDAYRRGLRYGDEIVSFGGRPIRTVNAFKNVLGIYPKSWIVPLSYRRDGKTHDIFVRLAGVHGAQELIDLVTGKPQIEVEPPKPNDGTPPGPRDEKPADKPEEEKPTPKPGKTPPKGFHARKAPPPMPEIVKQHFTERRGYANYYFNLLNRTRIWNAFRTQGNFGSAGGLWTLRGQLVTTGDAEFQLTDQFAQCALPGGQQRVVISDDLTAAIEPPGSGGLLAAMHVWRRLLVHGPEKFGEVYYLGSRPIAGREGLADVLVGLYAGVECQFLFDPANGQLVAVELYLHPDEDPCELRFSQYEDVDGRQLPRAVECRHGDKVYAKFRFAEMKLEK